MRGQYESLKSYILRCALLPEVVLRASWIQMDAGEKDVLLVKFTFY